ncbi:MAG: hypothetical protein D6675_01225 [Gemmatimonadetes bacterium]|nr:MAG: hypothetical protein D6675_01225 [Gemmatimonadota bacterium]
MKKKVKRDDPQDFIDQLEDFYDEEDILESDFEIEDVDDFHEYKTVREVLGLTEIVPVEKLEGDEIIIELEKLQEKMSLHKMMIEVPFNVPLKEVYQYVTDIILQEEVPVDQDEWIVFDASLGESAGNEFDDEFDDEIIYEKYEDEDYEEDDFSELDF